MALQNNKSPGPDRWPITIIKSVEQHSMTRHILEHFNTLFSGTEQLFNISLHVNSSCLGLWSDIYSY